MADPYDPDPEGGGGMSTPESDATRVADVDDEPMDDDTFRSQIKTLITSARDHMDFDVLPQVEKATRYLNGEVDARPANYLQTESGTDVYEGSNVVLRECSDRFRMLLPEIARVFLASDEAVVFQPRTAEDEASAEQATDYINYVWRVRNNGEDLLLDLLHDWGVKFCALKVYWCDEQRTTTHNFDMPLEAFIALQQQAQSDDDILDLDGQPYQTTLSIPPPPPQAVPPPASMPQPGPPPDMGAVPGQQPPPEGAAGPQQPPGPPEGMPPQAGPPAVPLQAAGGPRLSVPVIMVKGTISRRESRGHIKIEAIPHDELLIDPDCRGAETALLVGTDQWLTVSDAVALGVDYDLAIQHATNLPSSANTNARFARRGHSDRLQAANEDQSLNWLRLVQAVVTIDRDQDGIAEKYRIIAIGEQFELVDAQLADDCMYIVGSPYRVPHEPIGLGIVEEMMDIQDIQTSLMRSSLDNYRRSNHPREVVAKTDLDAYEDLRSWYGGPIRALSPSNIGWHEVPFVGDKAFPYLQYFQGVGSMRTGIDPAGMGMDPDVLKGMSADGTKAVVTAPQSRMEYLIREFAVQIQRTLFRYCLQLSVRYQDKPAVVRLRNKWVEVDPGQWSAEMDCTVKVGLGTGTRQERLVGLMALMQKQEALLATGSPLVTLDEYRHSLAQLVELNGHRDTQKFFKDLSPQELAMAAQAMQQQQQQQAMLAIQAEVEKAKAVAQVKAAADLEKAKMDAEIARAKIEADQSLGRENAVMNMTAARDKNVNDKEVSQHRAVLDITMARDKAKQDSEQSQREAVMNIAVQRDKIAAQERVDMAKIQMEATLKREELEMEAELEVLHMQADSRRGNANIAPPKISGAGSGGGNGKVKIPPRIRSGSIKRGEDGSLNFEIKDN